MQNRKKIITRAVSFIIISVLYVGLLLGFSGAVEPANSLLAYPVTADRVIEKSFDVRADGLLQLNTRVGGVEVEGWDRDEVQLTIEVKGQERYIEDIEFFIESSIDGVEIRAEIPRIRSLFGDWGRRLNIQYTIMVPYEYNMDLRTSGGRITIKKVEGDINGRTSGGGVNAEDLSGAIALTTSGGGITLDRVRGDVVVRTSGGSITVNGAYGNLEARTSGGPIRMSDIDAQVDARTSGGGITFESVGINRGLSLRTSGGSINVALPEDINANINARTSGGRVSTDFPITMQGSISSSSIEGTINNGGPEIVLRTSGGSIRINKN